MFRFCMESDVDIALQKIAQSGSDPILLSCRELLGGRHQHLLRPLRFIHQLGERFGDVGEEIDAVLFYQLIEEPLNDRRASQFGGHFEQDVELGGFGEHRRGNGMPQSGRLRKGLTQSIESESGRLDARRIKKFKQSFCVSTCDGCLNHNNYPLQ